MNPGYERPALEHHGRDSLYYIGMVIRKAVVGDLPRLMAIYERARHFMASTGNARQWIDGYPSEELIRNEIKSRHCYVCSKDARIVGVFCFIKGEDPNYAHIEEGEWLNSEPYATIHRLATSGEERGVADTCFHWCMQQCANLRADTHCDNLIMQHILQKYGFHYCGIIYVANGTPRLAYQRCGHTSD